MVEEVELLRKIEIRSVNKALYERFKAVVVADNRGKMKGVLGKAIERAMKLYIQEIEGTSGIHISESTHTHTSSKKAYPLTSRGRRLRAIGNILFHNQISAIAEGKEFYLNEKGLERLVISQEISEKRVIKDYIHAMQVKGWIEKERSHYVIFSDRIGEDLNLQYPEGHIKKILEERKEEVLNGGANLTR